MAYRLSMEELRSKTLGKLADGSGFLDKKKAPEEPNGPVLSPQGLREKKKTLPNSSDEELIQEEPHGVAGYNRHFPELG